jgi:hypothetical protein
MATSRHFVDVSDADVARFSEENENENTKRMTSPIWRSSATI